MNSRKTQTSRGKILIYLQDVGGTSFLLPIIKEFLLNIKYSKNFIFIIHPLSKFKLDKIFPNIITISINCFPISEYEWKKLLDAYLIKSIICTLSENINDPTNANLISQSKKNKIPSIGFMDHWKGFHRLVSPNQSQNICPDWLGVIDKSSIKNLNTLDVGYKKVEVVGNPALEVIKKVISKSTTEKKYILLVSQPDVFSGSFNSMFDIKIQKKRLIDLISSSQIMNQSNLSLSFRPHPKDSNLPKLPCGIKLDVSSKSNVYENYDIFIGFDSMLLFEAHLAGRKSVSIELPEINKITKESTPYEYSFKINKINDLDDVMRGKFQYNGVRQEVFANSIHRSTNFLTNFLKCNYDS